MQIRLTACRQQLRPSRAAFSIEAVAATAQSYGKTEKVSHCSCKHLQMDSSRSKSPSIEVIQCVMQGEPNSFDFRIFIQEKGAAFPTEAYRTQYSLRGCSCVPDAADDDQPLVDKCT